MAVDEVLTESLARPGGRPFFRLYAWEPACLSLGRFQNPIAGLYDGILEQVPSVRRPTGGGAIWHSDELTYSLGFPSGFFGNSDVKSTYEKICGFLVETWKELGWVALFAKDSGITGQAFGSVTPACFAGKEAYDILVEGKKLGGNAQRRDRHIIFQHGSIPLSLDWPSMVALFLPAALPNVQQITSLLDLGYVGSRADLQSALSNNLSRILGIDLEPDTLTPHELSLAKEREQLKFSDRDWTLRGAGHLRS